MKGRVKDNNQCSYDNLPVSYGFARFLYSLKEAIPIKIVNTDATSPSINPGRRTHPKV